MKCTGCAYNRPMKVKKIMYDYSEKSGIPNCFITAKQYTCSKCKNVLTDLGDMQEVNEAIAGVLVRAVELTRPMAKYVRVHFFQESIFQFAKRIKMNPSVYDEIENLKRPMPLILSEKVKEVLELFFIKKEVGPVAFAVGNKKTKLKID